MTRLKEYTPFSTTPGNGWRPDTPFEKEWRAGCGEGIQRMIYADQQWQRERRGNGDASNVGTPFEIPFAGCALAMAGLAVVGLWILAILGGG